MDKFKNPIAWFTIAALFALLALGASKATRRMIES